MRASIRSVTSSMVKRLVRSGNVHALLMYMIELLPTLTSAPRRTQVWMATSSSYGALAEVEDFTSMMFQELARGLPCVR